jgi:hypothetical protein
MANPCEEDGMNTFRGRVEEYFRARPDQWIDGLAIAQVGGAYAWRSRVSDCRQRKVGEVTISEYRFVPARPVSQPRLFETSPW